MTHIFTSKTLTLTILGLSTLSFAGCGKVTEGAKPSPTMPEVLESHTKHMSMVSGGALMHLLILAE